VRPPEQRHVNLLEEAGEHLVGLDHEHLDERVRERVVLALGVDDAPVLVEDQDHFGELERDHALALAAALDGPGERVHLLQSVQELVGVLRGCLGVLACLGRSRRR
jgi:hypothetical protein